MPGALMVSLRDLDTLARTIYGEARGESLTGKIAVGWVVRNRLAAARFGASIERVCRAPFQFSCWNSGDPNLAQLESVTSADPVFRDCICAAYAVLMNEVPDPTAGATHYHTPRVSPAWSRGHEACARVGAHEFYNDVR
jgi:spore germination cell wall hydrolase CwlJ-like protein